MKTIKKKFISKLVLFVFFIFTSLCACWGINQVTVKAEWVPTIKFSIYSSYSDDTDSLGHSWLVIENDTNEMYDFYNTVIGMGETVTIGTWGNCKDPETQKVYKGAWLNLEAYFGMWRNNTASLTMEITATQLSQISKKCISMNEWSAVNNCSYFASKVWNAIAPSNLQVSSYTFPANYPKTLKASIEKKEGYETNRKTAYNDYTGYCPNDTTFKYIIASTIIKNESSGSIRYAFEGEQYCYTSFPNELNELEKFLKACS